MVPPTSKPSPRALVPLQGIEGPRWGCALLLVLIIASMIPPMGWASTPFVFGGGWLLLQMVREILNPRATVRVSSKRVRAGETLVIEYSLRGKRRAVTSVELLLVGEEESTSENFDSSSQTKTFFERTLLAPHEPEPNGVRQTSTSIPLDVVPSLTLKYCSIKWKLVVRIVATGESELACPIVVEPDLRVDGAPVDLAVSRALSTIPNVIHLPRTDFVSGDVVEGRVLFDSVRAALMAPGKVEVRLRWYTEHSGSEEERVVATRKVTRENPAFSFRLPAAPQSFSGQVLSVVWAIEVVAWLCQVPITVSPARPEAATEEAAS